MGRTDRCGRGTISLLWLVEQFKGIGLRAGHRVRISMDLRSFLRLAPSASPPDQPISSSDAEGLAAGRPARREACVQDYPPSEPPPHDAAAARGRDEYVRVRAVGVSF